MIGLTEETRKVAHQLQLVGTPKLGARKFKMVFSIHSCRNSLAQVDAVSAGSTHPSWMIQQLLLSEKL